MRKRIDRNVARETAQVTLGHVVVANLIRREMAEAVYAPLYTVDEAIPEAQIIVQIARAIEVEKRADMTEAADARSMCLTENAKPAVASTSQGNFSRQMADDRVQ